MARVYTRRASLPRRVRRKWFRPAERKPQWSGLCRHGMALLELASREGEFARHRKLRFGALNVRFQSWYYFEAIVMEAPWNLQSP